ncbi:hypothetical protein [Flexivirga lutea]
MSLRSRLSKLPVAPSVVVAGVLGTTALALTTTGTLSAFAASIQNTVNTTTTGSLVLQEQNSDGSVTCLSTDGNTTNAATCSTINKYGGQSLAPGGSTTTTVKLTNQGSVTPKTFTMTPGNCTQSGAPQGVPAATDFCSKVNLNVYAAATATGTPIYTGSLDTFTTTPQTLTALAPKASQAYTFVVSMPANLGNGHQGLTASQPMTWAMSS